MPTTAHPVVCFSAVLIGWALAALPAPALAQTGQERGQFDLLLTGITAATLDYSARQEGDDYAVTAGFTSTGLLALMRRVQFEAQAEGVIAGGLPRPARYAARAEVGRRSGETVMEYVDGVPLLRVDHPPREAADWHIDAAAQGGTVDPISALYVTLRDVAPGAECNLAFRMFDGRRATTLTVGPSRPGENGGVICDGEYRRVAGYAPEDMAEKTSFPFTLTFQPAPDGRLRVMEVTMDSLIGKARLVRR